MFSISKSVHKIANPKHVLLVDLDGIGRQEVQEYIDTCDGDVLVLCACFVHAGFHRFVEKFITQCNKNGVSAWVYKWKGPQINDMADHMCTHIGTMWLMSRPSIHHAQWSVISKDKGLRSCYEILKHMKNNPSIPAMKKDHCIGQF